MRSSTLKYRSALAKLLAFVLIIPPLSNLFVQPVAAFLPDQRIANLLSAGDSITHWRITEMGVRSVVKELFPNVSNLATSNAEFEIARANASVDDQGKPEYLESKAHFDGESFIGSQNRLVSFKENVITALNQNNAAEARIHLGRALHTLQDFYSHSNWVENGNTNNTFDKLGDRTIPGSTLSTVNDFTTTCTDCPRNNCASCDALIPNAPLTTGYYTGEKERPKGNKTWKCSHGGKVTPIVGLTFGDAEAPGSFGNGINKDSTNCQLSPHDGLHETAAKLAIPATHKYIMSIKDRVGLDKMKVLFGISDTLAFAVDTTGSMGEELAQVKQKITQIVDARVNSGAAATTRYVLVPFNDPGGPYDPFNSNNLGPITSTDNPTQFKNAVNNLTAQFGGDCPELAYTAMQKALQYIDGDGNLFVFTDAAAKDDRLAWLVRTSAKRQKVPIYIIFSGLDEFCPGDPGYAVTARETGGKLFEVFPDEVGNLVLLADILAQPNRIHLRSINGFLNGTLQTFTFPIDSFWSRFTIMITGVGATNIVIHRPDGIPILSTDPGVSFFSFGNGVIYSISTPMPGLWNIAVSGSAGSGAASTPTLTKEELAAINTNANVPKKKKGGSASAPTVQLSSSGEFQIGIVGESSLKLQSFSFVERRGREGHHGMFPLKGSPIAGQLTSIAADITPVQFNSLQFQFRALDETVLQTFAMEELQLPVEPGEPPPADLSRMFQGEVVVPSVPFHVYMTGTDPTGHAIERRLPELFEPQSVKVSALQLPDMYPGQSLTHAFDVTNFGAADTFRLIISDSSGYARSINPVLLSLAANETRQALLQIQIPQNAPIETLASIAVTAESISSPDRRNTAALDPFRIKAAPSLKVSNVTATPLGGNGDTVIDPGEGGAVKVTLLNTGAATATNISATLVASTPGIIVTSADSTYPNIAPAGSAMNSSSFLFFLPPTASCGTKIEFVLIVNADTGEGVDSSWHNFTLQTGQPGSTNATTSFTGPPVPIPDANLAGVDVPITVSNFNGTLTDLNFRFDGTTCNTNIGSTTVGLDHTFVSDLVITLTSPQGTTISLVGGAGGSGNNFCQTLLDDEGGGLSIFSGSAPFIGTFTPAEPLANFRGENPNGTWKLHVTDEVATDTGNVRAFSLIMSGVNFSCGSVATDTTGPTCTETGQNPGPPPSGNLTVQDTGFGLADIRVLAADNVQVNVPSFTAGTTAPVIVTGTLVDTTRDGSFTIQSVDVAGNVSSCSRTVAAPAQQQPKILFRTNRDGRYELYMMNDDGSNLTRLTNTTNDEYVATWSPNGQKVAFSIDIDGSNAWDIVVMNPDGSNRLNLTNSLDYDFEYDWSPDSTKIVFESDRGPGPFALFVVNADGTGAITRIVDTGGGDKRPAWSPDGSKIAFVNYLNTVNNKADISVVGPDGSNLTNLTQSDAVENMPVWSPDGTKILFGRRFTVTFSPYNLYVMNADGSGVQQLTTFGVTDYRWSPDGTKIVFQTNRDGNDEVYVMNANGSNQINLTNNSGTDYSPLFSSDGLRILFGSWRTGNSEIFIMNANGSGQVNLTNNPANDSWFRWKP